MSEEPQTPRFMPADTLIGNFEGAELVELGREKSEAKERNKRKILEKRLNTAGIRMREERDTKSGKEVSIYQVYEAFVHKDYKDQMKDQLDKKRREIQQEVLNPGV